MRKLNSLTLPWPVNWAELFGRPAPLILEIGFGRGLFLLHLAQTYPDANIIGLEISSRCLNTTEHAIERQKLTNVRVIHSTAETALFHLFEPQTISQIHINFPDPWFKTRHSHRRLMQRDTLDALVSRLIPGGALYLATDILPYAEMSNELFAETPGLDNQLNTPWADNLPGRVVTKYEAAARREGRACYYFAYRRNQHPAPPVPVFKELAMPHIVFSSPLSIDEMLAAFQPEQYAEGETIISFMQVYRGRESLLYEVFVKEVTIDQHIALMLLPRTDGNYTIQLGTIGIPRPTSGVHEAVLRLGNHLVGLHPEARIVNSKVQDLGDDEEP